MTPDDGDNDGQPDSNERAEHDQKLADEAVEPGQPDRREHHDHEDRGVNRDALPQPAELGNLARVAPHVEHPDQQKQSAGGNAVIEHLVNRAVDALGVERENSEHHETQVTNRRIGNQALEIGLHHRDQRAVDDPDHGERHEQRNRLDGDGRETAESRSAESRRCPS